NWFDVDVQRGLEDALTLSQIALDVEKRRSLDELQRLATRLPDIGSANLVSEIGVLRRESGAEELSLFGANNRIVATSSSTPGVEVLYPSDELLFQLRDGRPYVSFEPLPDGEYQIVTALNVGRGRSEPLILQARFPVEQRLSALANSVQETSDEYLKLDYLRAGLKAGFTMTLSLVLLVSVLASVYGAFTSARRLVGPIQQLMQG